MTVYALIHIILIIVGIIVLFVVYSLVDRPWKSHNQNRGYICPYNNSIDCPYIDTAGMTKTKECRDCENYKPKKYWIELK